DRPHEPVLRRSQDPVLMHDRSHDHHPSNDRDLLDEFHGSPDRLSLAEEADAIPEPLAEHAQRRDDRDDGPQHLPVFAQDLRNLRAHWTTSRSVARRRTERASATKKDLSGGVSTSIRSTPGTQARTRSPSVSSEYWRSTNEST